MKFISRMLSKLNAICRYNKDQSLNIKAYYLIFRQPVAQTSMQGQTKSVSAILHESEDVALDAICR